MPVAGSDEEVVSIRKNLLLKAISFLSNPNVVKGSNDDKRGFLLSKGLNNQELDLALKFTMSRPGNENELRQELDLLNILANKSTLSFADRLLNLCILAGFAYGTYTFVKKIVMPYYFPERNVVRKSDQDDVSANIIEMNAKLSSLVCKFTIMQQFLDNFVLSHESFSTKVLKELKIIKVSPGNFATFSVPSIPTSKMLGVDNPITSPGVSDMIENMNWSYEDADNKRTMSDSTNTDSSQSIIETHSQDN